MCKDSARDREGPLHSAELLGQLGRLSGKPAVPTRRLNERYTAFRPAVAQDTLIGDSDYTAGWFQLVTFMRSAQISGERSFALIFGIEDEHDK